MSEKTLSINHIYTLQRELFYWAIVMATFALGTAAGDMTASNFGLGTSHQVYCLPCYFLYQRSHTGAQNLMRSGLFGSHIS